MQVPRRAAARSACGSEEENDFVRCGTPEGVPFRKIRGARSKRKVPRRARLPARLLGMTSQIGDPRNPRSSAAKCRSLDALRREAPAAAWKENDFVRCG